MHSTIEGTLLTCFIVPTTHYEIDHLVPVQGVLVSHDTEGSETPIHGVHSEVRGKVVYEIILILKKGHRMSRIAAQSR